MRRAFAGLVVGVFIVVFVAAQLSYAAIPKLITVEGKLRNSTTNDPLVGTYNVTFSIWDDATVGNMLWWENQTVNTDSFGIFQVIMGSKVPITLSFTPQNYLEITVNGTKLSPRSTLTSTPTTYRANVSEVAEDVQCSGCVGTADIANNAVTTGKVTNGAITVEKYNCTDPHGPVYNASLIQNCTISTAGICNDNDGCTIRVFYTPSIIFSAPAPSWGWYYQYPSTGSTRFRTIGFEGSATAVTHTGTHGDVTNEVVLWGSSGCDVWDDGASMVASDSTNFTVKCGNTTNNTSGDPTTNNCWYYFCD